MIWVKEIPGVEQKTTSRAARESSSDMMDDQNNGELMDTPKE